MKRRSLEAILQALDTAKVRYLVVGGLAVVVHGYVRYTGDVALVIEPDPAVRRRAVEALRKLGYTPRLPVPFESYADPVQIARWRDEKNMLAFTATSHEHPETDLDLFVGDAFDFESAYGRARCEEIAPGIVMTVVPRAELLDMKRRAGRTRDRDDIEALEIIGDTGQDIA